MTYEQENVDVLLNCANNTWTFNVICGVHNHGLGHKLANHMIVCHMNVKEKKLVSDITLNMDQSKNILSNLKRKRSKSISNIRQACNVHNRNNNG